MGVAAIHGAANRGANDVIEYLAANGARLDVADAQGRTPLDWAEGVFLATHPPVRKPETIALLERLQRERAPWQPRTNDSPRAAGSPMTDERTADADATAPLTRRRVLRTASTLAVGATLAHALGDTARAQPPAPAPLRRGSAADSGLRDARHPDERRRHDPRRQGRQRPAAAAAARRAAHALHVARRRAAARRGVHGRRGGSCAATATAASRTGLPDHSNYSKRAMALDQVDVMRHFGFERFAVVGQDRGGRVAHRMALDHPDARDEGRLHRHRADAITSTRT